MNINQYLQKAKDLAKKSFSSVKRSWTAHAWIKWVLVLAIGAGIPVLYFAEEQVPEEEDQVVACVEAINKAASGSNGESGGGPGDDQIHAMQEENAKKIYSFFKVYGLSDKQIAGFLGNWTEESGVDATTIEGFYGSESKFTMTDEKLKVAKDASSHFYGYLLPEYSKEYYIDPLDYTGADGKIYVGMGLFQATGPSGYDMVKAAEAQNVDWWDFDWQLAYATFGYRPWFFEYEEWKAMANGDLDIISDFVLAEYEGVAGMKAAERRAHTRQWYDRLKDWQVDEAYGESILAMAGDMAQTATRKDVYKAVDACRVDQSYGTYDNSSIAYAASSLAWDTEEEAAGSDGTELYQEVYKAIQGGYDPEHPWGGKSCDIFVSVSIRWAGADDNFQDRGPLKQANYMAANTDKWKYIGTTQDSLDKLEPGDILTMGGDGGDGHIFVYTGTEAVEAMHPKLVGLGLDSAHAAWWEDKPCRSGFIMECDINGFLAYNHWPVYKIFRNIKPEENSKFKDVAVSSRPKGSSTSSSSSGSSGPTFNEKKMANKLKGIKSFSPDFSKTKAWGKKNPFPIGNCSWFVWGCFQQVYGYDPVFTWKNNKGDWAHDIAEKIGKNDSNFKVSDTPAKGAIGSLGNGEPDSVSHIIFVTNVSADGKTMDYWEANMNNQIEGSLQDFISKNDYRKVVGASVESVKENEGKGDLKFAVPRTK